MVPPVEIRSGLRAIVEDHLGVEPETAIIEVTRMLGFQRTGSELHRVIERELREMLHAGVLRYGIGNRLYTTDE
jgi:hypothetical protein